MEYILRSFVHKKKDSLCKMLMNDSLAFCSLCFPLIVDRFYSCCGAHYNVNIWIADFNFVNSNNGTNAEKRMSDRSEMNTRSKYRQELNRSGISFETIIHFVEWLRQIVDFFLLFFFGFILFLWKSKIEMLLTSWIFILEIVSMIITDFEFHRFVYS